MVTSDFPSLLFIKLTIPGRGYMHHFQNRSRVKGKEIAVALAEGQKKSVKSEPKQQKV